MKASATEHPLDDFWLQRLRCPVSGSRLHWADAAALDRIKAVDAPAQALVTENGRHAYPVIDGLPVLLVESAIAVE